MQSNKKNSQEIFFSFNCLFIAGKGFRVERVCMKDTYRHRHTENKIEEGKTMGKENQQKATEKRKYTCCRKLFPQYYLHSPNVRLCWPSKAENDVLNVLHEHAVAM